MKKAYVTGATGCVGRNLVNELLKDKWKVIVLHRKTSDISKLKEVDVEFKEVDFYDLKSLSDNISLADAIFHVAGNTSHWSKESETQWKDNVLATRNLVQVAINKKIKRFIFTSTGATEPDLFKSNEEINEIKCNYIRTKKLAELEVYEGVKAGLDAVILNPIIVIGAYDYNSYSQIFTYIKNNRFRLVFPGNINFCHAKEIAEGHLKAFYYGKTGQYYYLYGTPDSWLNVFKEMSKLMNVKEPKFTTPRFVLYAISYLMLLISYFTGKKPQITPEIISLIQVRTVIPTNEIEKTKRDLKYNPTSSLKEMIKDCYDWMRKENKI